MDAPTTNQPPMAEAAKAPRDPIFLLGATLLGMVIVALVATFILQQTRSSQTRQATAKADELDRRIADDAELSQTVAQYSSLQSIVTHMDKLLDDRFLFLPAWQRIKASVPTDVQFVTVSMGDGNTFRISGVAANVTAVANFAEALGKQSELSVVTPLSMDKQALGELYNFSLTFKVDKNAIKKASINES